MIPLLEKLYRTAYSGGVKLGLENSRRLAQLLSHPEKRFASVHIAGTNGKGSVATKIAAGLMADGKRVGLFTSPHISSFRERIRLNGEVISEIALEKELSSLFSLVETEGISATFFELTTLLAFSFFAKEKVDIAVVEVGLGGRLDATNILTPLLSILTSLARDHTEILGDDLEQIAREKLGIAKPGVPLLLGSTFFAKTPMTFEEENRETAAEALKRLGVSEEAIAIGIAARPPCRFERIERGGRTIILDVAHNPNAIFTLLTAIRKRWPYRKLRCIIGVAHNKDLSGIFLPLRHEVAAFYLFNSSHPRLTSPEKLTPFLSPDRYQIYASAAAATSAALVEMEKEELLLVCGSFYIMAEVRSFLGISEPRDYLDLSENFHKR